MTQRRIYQEEYPYFVTFRTREGFMLFEEVKYAKLLSRIMFKACTLKHFDLLAYQIMLDHVHLLVLKSIAGTVLNFIAGTETRDGRGRQHKRFTKIRTRVSPPAFVSKMDHCTISDLMYCIKSYFFNEVRKHYNIPYSIWHSRFYSRIVETKKYLETVIYYIEQNPIKAKLPSIYHEKPYQYFNRELIEVLF